MFGVDWSDPQTLWLNLTNLALGLITLLAVVIMAGGIAWELLLKRRRAREIGGLDAELHTLLNPASPHILSVPELGLTMADGGAPLKRSPEEPAVRNRTRK